MDAKYKIILDLDNTIICSLGQSEEKPIHKQKFSKFVWKDMDGDYKVFQRPHLQEFLDFLFANFDVSVWTAASKGYAIFIIDNFILIKPDRHLEWVFFSHHCRESIKNTTAQKNLAMLWTVFNLDNYNQDNTYIIDDSEEVYETQPNRCILAPAFEFEEKTSFADDKLLTVIKPKLESLLLKELQ